MIPFDVLLALPKDLEGPKPEEYIVPPKWVVRMVSTNDGKAGKKYPANWSQSMYSTGTGDDMADYYPWGMCGDAAGPDTARGSWERSRQRPVRDFYAEKPIRGNLREEEYRFWNGNHAMNSEVATCRWCKTWCYGRDAMQKHQSETEHLRILREIYDFARKQGSRLCFSCGIKTSYEHWGIPLCCTLRCLNRWRVAPIAELSGTLHLYAKFAKRKGVLAPWIKEDGSEKYNVESNPKKFNWDSSTSF